MWPWQRKKSDKNNHKLLWRVFQISVIGHLIVLLFFLVGSRESALHVSMRVFPAQARIVCVPSFMLPSCKNRYAGRKGRTTTSASHEAVRAEPLQATAAKQQEKVTSVQAVHKHLSKRELRRERALARKQEREKKQQEAREAQLAAKLTAQQRKAKLAAQRVADEQKQALEQEQQEAKRSQEHSRETAESSSSQKADGEVGEGDGSDETVIYVDSATFQMTELVKELQQALQEVWQPPAGFAVGYACEVKVTVSGSGMATAVNVYKKSGAAIYDMAARHAASAAVYPKLVYNRTLVIHFGE